MPVMPDPFSGYDDAEVVWSSEFPDGVGVRVATNLWDSPNEDVREPDQVPIRVSVTTEDGTGSAYLTVEDAYQLVQLLGMAITKAKNLRP
jgi:hypothetical protein